MKHDFVMSTNGIPYILSKNALVEASRTEWEEHKKLVRFERPALMTRSAIRTAMTGPRDFEFSYKYPGEDSDEQNGHRNSVSILFGCTRFSRENYRKLRAWALK